MGASNSRPEPVVQQLTEGGENAKISYGVSTIRRKNVKQSASAFAAVPNLDNLTSFFGVYDGDEGVEVALLCATQFHNELRNHPFYKHNLNGAIRMTFYRMDELLQLSDEWKKLLPRAPSGPIQRLFRKACSCAYRWPFTQPPPYIPPQESGCTACVAAIRGYKIIIGNAGHSRCIISRNGQAIELTTDHKPENRNERRRIERAGGQVIKDRVVELPGEAEGFFQQRGSGTARINGILTHSRAIGYFAFKNSKNLNYQRQMVTCNPEVITMGITNDVEFLVIVSEGIWTFLTSQGVVDFIRSQLAAGTTNLRTICRRLCDHCELAAYNVTAILVQFMEAPPPKPKENLSGDNGNSNESGGNGNNNGAPPQAPEENLSGGNGNNSYDAPAAALEEQEEHEVYEQPEGREDQPLLTDHEITED
ncbi:hypothetical protein SEVIR_1G262400v4 [Setaria viridis]|uniref:protein-serine/threonine phosphatase n=1 Tax=Setaria viridis TaxID=4556 RepID=A0A4U6WDR7_SETVI|nr:probable protein phosphatase 2C 21 [Setaria viridis]TKW40691.1 hypothetical protein SEVIR_1G262400v2 [Setaria viridis]TKW40692.1 hypothetical protein SEVIR_1G262400v2 [Setaria viridis]TKW40693.1 hypothetical protein SEVIR_1G262400v2 [Setaria viridis]